MNEDISGSISVLRVKPGDCIVFEVDVGNLPPSRVKEFIERVKESVKDAFPPDVKVLYLPRTASGNGTKIKVLSFG